MQPSLDVTNYVRQQVTGVNTANKRNLILKLNFEDRRNATYVLPKTLNKSVILQFKLG